MARNTKTKSQQSASDSDVEALRAAIASLSAQTLASAGARYLGEEGLGKLIELIRAEVRDAGYLPLTGGTLTGDLTVRGTTSLAADESPDSAAARGVLLCEADGRVTCMTLDALKGLFLGYSFTINATPSRAEIRITAGGTTYSGTGSLTVTVPSGTAAEWEVSCDGYGTQRGSLFPAKDTALDIALVEHYLIGDFFETDRTAKRVPLSDYIITDADESEGDEIDIFIADGDGWLSLDGNGLSTVLVIDEYEGETASDIRDGQIGVHAMYADGTDLDDIVGVMQTAG